MRLIPILLLAALLFATSPMISAQAAAPIRILMDGLSVESEVAPIIQDGRTLVPLRVIAEALNKSVSWDQSTRTVTASGDGVSVSLVIGQKAALVNGKSSPIDVASSIVEGRTMVPVRFMAEAFGCAVSWDGQSRTVLMKSPVMPMSILAFYALGSDTSSSWSDLFGAAYPAFGSERTDRISDVALGWYSVDKTGNLITNSSSGWKRPPGWEVVVSACDLRGLSTEMVVFASDSSGLLSSVLEDSDASRRAAKAIALESRQYDGVNLDFEEIGYSKDPAVIAKKQTALVSFVKVLSEELRRQGRKLTLTVHPPNSVYKGYDYKALEPYADRFVVMAYEYGTKPEPQSLVMAAVEQMVSMVPKKKVLLGVSAASETAESLTAKLGIAKRFGLSGVALWRLGLVSPSMWDALYGSVRPAGVR